MKPLVILDVSLTPPQLPQSVNGLIDISTLPQNKIIVVVEPYYNISTGDRISVSFGNLASEPYIVEDGQQQGPMQFAFDTDSIPNGNYHVAYTAVDSSSNASHSPSVSVRVVNSTSSFYPPPIFVDYPYNIIGIQSVIDNEGVMIRCSYSDMTAGDIVTFYWQGTDSNGKDVPQSHFSKELTVVAQNVQDKFVQVQIPSANITCLNSLGCGAANYTVKLNLKGGDYSSSTTNALIVWSDIDQLKLSLAQDAPPRSATSAPFLLCANSAVVFGPPGDTVEITANNNAIINDQNTPGLPYRLNLDENGLARFFVSLASLNSRDLTSIIMAKSLIKKPPKPASLMMSFSGYKRGTAGIVAYGFTTSAVADGISPCSIYILAEQGTQSVDVFGAGDFLINGRSNYISTPLNADLTATVNIITDTPQLLTIYVKATDSPDTAVPVMIEFVSVPGLH